MLFILQILHFYLIARLVLLFCPLRSIFMRFLGHSSFIFQRIMKAVLNALLLRYDTCMYAKKKKSTQKGPFPPKRKKTQFFFVFRLRSTKLKLGLHIYIGQVKFDFELIRTKNKEKLCFFAVDPIWRKFDWNLSHILIFLQFFKMSILRHQYISTNI